MMPSAWNLRARLRRPRPAAPRLETIRIEGDVARDFEVAADYPGAITREIACHRWSDRRDETATLCLIPLDRAIVTGYFLGVDPVRHRLFENQSYDGLRLAPPADFPIHGDRFTLAADDVATIEGPAVVIGGPVEGNYSHALFNWFLRFLTLELIAPDVARDPAVRFLVDRRAQAEPFRAMLAALRVPLDRVIWVDHPRTYVVEQALLISFTSENAHYPELIRLLQDRVRGSVMPEGLPPQRRRIWISREHLGPDHRLVSNMDAIRPILARHGFEEVALETLSFPDQVRLFAEAEIVMGSHGAGFANIIFCQPGTRILVIEKDFNRMLRFDRFFSGLATICGLAPQTIPGRTDRPPDHQFIGFFDRHRADVVVDPADVEAALAAVVTPPPRA